MRRRDLTPAARKIETKLRARLRHAEPSLDLDAVFDRLRPQLADLVGDGRIGTRQMRDAKYEPFTREMAAIVAEVRARQTGN